MFRLVAVYGVLVCLWGISLARAGSCGEAQATPPAIHIEGVSGDLGELVQGDVLRHRIEYENRGGSPLVIHKIRPACGAYVSKLDSGKTIAPGDKGSFVLGFDTYRLRAGARTVCGRIYCNDPKRPEIPIRLRMVIRTIVDTEPTFPRLLWLPGAGPAQIAVTLSRAVPEDIKILKAENPRGRLTLDLRETEPGRRYQLLAKTDGLPEDREYSWERIELDIQTGGRRVKQIFCIVIQRRNRIELTTKYLHFGPADLRLLAEEGKPVVKTVAIKAAFPEPYRFKIEARHANRPKSFFKLHIEPVKEGREYRLVVTVDKMPSWPEDSKRKSLREGIVLTTDEPEQPEIKLTCRASN